MAGFREFVTGEVLTASNVDDFLMKQSVQKYADAAARDAALGTAVAGGNALREGMVAWLDDTNSVIAYDGTAWNPVGAAGIKQIVSGTSTSSFMTTSATYVDVTDFTVSITPGRTDSKVLVVASLVQQARGINVNFGLANVRITDGSDNTIAGLAEGQFGFEGFTRIATNQDMYSPVTIFGVDSPATTSAVTYKVRLRCPETNSQASVRGDLSTSTLYAFEVEA